MERETMIRSAGQCLEDEGYIISCGSGCFDIMARKDESIALKALANADSFTRCEAEDLKTISQFLGTFPLLVADRANRYRLEESIVYERHGVAAMSCPTFERFVRGFMPAMRARRGGYTASVDPERAQEGLERSGLSVAQLSSKSGISCKTVYRLAMGDQVDVRTCDAVERTIGMQLGAEGSISRGAADSRARQESGFRRTVSEHLERMGFGFSFLTRSPFNLILKDEETLVSMASESKGMLASHAELLRGFGRDFGIDTVFITHYGGCRSMKGVPMLSIGEVKSMDSPKEFVEIIKERQE